MALFNPLDPSGQTHFMRFSLLQPSGVAMPCHAARASA
jgi:hypothetical protein